MRYADRVTGADMNRALTASLMIVMLTLVSVGAKADTISLQCAGKITFNETTGTLKNFGRIQGASDSFEVAISDGSKFVMNGSVRGIVLSTPSSYQLDVTPIDNMYLLVSDHTLINRETGKYERTSTLIAPDLEHDKTLLGIAQTNSTGVCTLVVPHPKF